MLSEWLVDIPDDLTDEWLMLICPVGKRNLVIASNVSVDIFSIKKCKTSESNQFCVDCRARQQYTQRVASL